MSVLTVTTLQLMGADNATGMQVSRPGAPCLSGTGELASLVRRHDWSTTPLGPIEDWPQSLRSVVNVLLTSRYAMWMAWGDKLTMLYNDAYRPTLGIKHPWALGTPAAEVWAEIWPDIYPRIETVLSTGQATYDEALLLFLQRSGFPEETYHTFSYSPLADDSGRVSGMLCVVTEETDRIINERRMSTLRELASALGACITEAEVLAAADRQLAANTRDLPFAFTYLYDSGGDARLACTTDISDGHPACPPHIPSTANAPWPASELRESSGTPLLIDLGAQPQSVPLPRGSWDRVPEQAAVVPIKQQGHDHPAGFLVVGLNPYRRYDAAYAGFVDLVAGQLAAGIASARAYDAERRRAKALAELDHAKTQFFSNVSHEFRTPLTLMLGPLEDMLAQPSGRFDPENRELVTVVHRNGLRLLRLVNSLLDFSRIEAGRMKAEYAPTDLAALTAELASSFRSAAERAGLQFVVDCTALTELAYVDREMWEKIVFNLLSNAFKFTFEGGITVRLREAGECAELSVVDTGAGIPEGELPRIFERFHRVEAARGRTFEGSGIGLALVQELVHLHSGSIRVESVLDRGTTFVVTLPLGKNHLQAERITRPGPPGLSTAVPAEAFVEEALRWLPDELPAPLNQLPGSGIAGEPASEKTGGKAGTVLVADDNADMREYVRRLLRTDYHVVTASNGHDALRLAYAEHPDLVLSDVMMPGLDGLSLLEALRSDPQTRTTPVILLSARAGEEARSEGMDAGADDYIGKPFSARELLARVGAHLKLARIRKDTEEALRISEERLQQVFAQAPVGVLVLRGRDLVIELANAEYQKFFRGRELLGRPFREAVPEVSEELLDLIDGVFRTGEPFVGHEYLVPLDRDGDGVVEDGWFTFVYQPLRGLDGQVSGILLVVIDVTTHARAREGLERVNRELEEFAYVSSHDMQEPLRMVNIYTHLLLKSLATETREIQEYARFVRQGVLRMEHLIRDLLSYSRVIHSDGLAAGTADLSQSLSQALDTIRPRIDESQARITAADLPRVRGDTAQLAHVFQNLLSNSMKYRKTGTQPEIHVSAERTGNQWTIAVRDNGIGFEQKYAERIFGLFKRLHKDEYDGTGLGLAICQRIVERFGGKMWAEGRPGDGATFYFTLTGVEAQLIG